jgi:hypothetical protein
VSCRLSVYAFVLTQFKALANASSLPSPQSDGSIHGYLGFANPEPAPSAFVSATASIQWTLLTVYTTIGSTTGPLISARHSRGFGPKSNSLHTPCLVHGGQQLGWANTLRCWSTSRSHVRLDSSYTPLLLKRFPRYLAPWDFTQPTHHLAAPTEALTTMATLEAGPSTSLGKRSRQRYETYNYDCPVA